MAMAFWRWAALPDDASTTLPVLIRLLNIRMGKLQAAVAALVGALGKTGTFANGAATPSVSGAFLWIVQNTAPTNITALRDGTAGAEVLLWSTTANTTLVHSAALRMQGAANVTMTATETRRFATVDGLTWREV